MDEISLYLEGVEQLDHVLCARQTECSRKGKLSVRLFASLILYILHLLKQMGQEKLEEASKTITKCQKKLHKSVNEWVRHYGVIGGNMFGLCIVTTDSVPYLTERELKVIFMNNSVLCKLIMLVLFILVMGGYA